MRCDAFCTTLFFACIMGLPACKAKKEDLQTRFNNYRFDNSVVQKLPLYDSLVAAIYKNRQVLINYSTQDGGMHGFSYAPASSDRQVFKKLPAETGGSIDTAYRVLGEKYITGFDLFPDSTVRIYIRRNNFPQSSINIDEYLSFLPAGKNMRKREFPEKDTVLNASWQYWARVNDQGIF